jgi:hypothetical protein
VHAKVGRESTVRTEVSGGSQQICSQGESVAAASGPRVEGRMSTCDVKSGWKALLMRMSLYYRGLAPQACEDRRWHAGYRWGAAACHGLS